MQTTLAIIKPDAVKKRIVGKILQRIEDEGFDIREMRLQHMTPEVAKGFYAVHKEKSWFPELIAFMSSGASVVMMLEGEDAIARWRAVMGATDPSQAKPGTLRRQYGFSIERNATHGSDSIETAETEIRYFFKK